MPLRRSTCVYVAEKLPDGKRHFTGGFWVVDSEEELGKAVSRPETSPIEGLSAPCGGKGVTVRDPRGHRVRFIYGRRLRGREQLSPLEKTEPVFNGAVEKPRQGAWCRFKQGASLVHKLGHYGFVVPASKFESTKEWYTLNPETENDEICFFHIDLGAEYTDHHSMFFAAGPDGPTAHVHHSSYEVTDFEASVGYNVKERQGSQGVPRLGGI